MAGGGRRKLGSGRRKVRRGKLELGVEVGDWRWETDVLGRRWDMEGRVGGG